MTFRRFMGRLYRRGRPSIQPVVVEVDRPSNKEILDELRRKNQVINFVIQMNFAELERRALALDIEKYKALFEGHEDPYLGVAAELFAVPEAEVTPEMRQWAKLLSYRKMYSDGR